MPVSLAMFLLVLAVVFAAVAPHLERRRAGRVRIVDHRDPAPVLELVDAGPGAGPLPPLPDDCYPPGAVPLPVSFEQLPGHRRHRHLAAVIPTRTKPFNWEIEGL